MRYAYFFVLAVFGLTSISFAHAQSASVPFQPGEWQINAGITPSMGHIMQHENSACIKSPTEALKSHRPNEKCTAPTLTSIANGYHIKMECSGGNGQAQWKSDSSMDEIFSDGGKAFDAKGKATTTVSISGNAPMTMSATMHITGKRTGDCK